MFLQHRIINAGFLRNRLESLFLFPRARCWVPAEGRPSLGCHSDGDAAAMSELGSEEGSEFGEAAKGIGVRGGPGGAGGQRGRERERERKREREHLRDEALSAPRAGQGAFPTPRARRSRECGCVIPAFNMGLKQRTHAFQLCAEQPRGARG